MNFKKSFVASLCYVDSLLIGEVISSNIMAS